MYNLRSNSKDTVQFPIQIEVADDSQFLNDLLNHKASSINDSADMSDFHESSDSDIDCDALVRDSESEVQSTSPEVRSYADILALDRIRRANMQKHMPVSQVTSPQKFNTGIKFGKTTKSMSCTYFNQDTCLQ